MKVRAKSSWCLLLPVWSWSVGAVSSVREVSSVLHRPSSSSSSSSSLLIGGRRSSSSSWRSVPRGGETVASAPPTDVVGGGGGGGGVVGLLASIARECGSSLARGPRTDALLMAATTAFGPVLCRTLLGGVSPVLGHLALGVVTGPQGLGWVRDAHLVEALADVGIVLFLFEMGLHLDPETLWGMRRDVFGLGGGQFLVTAAAIAVAAKSLGVHNDSSSSSATASLVVLGGGLALSSSAFVLQTLKDTNRLSTTMGRSSLGVLLLQDLAVVPLLVVTPILAGAAGDVTVGEALTKAGTQLVLALAATTLVGRRLLPRLLDLVDDKGDEVAAIGLLLGSVLSFAFLTEGLGLSNTLGAFLAGLVLSTTPRRKELEDRVAPFRGILVGLFFFSVGFEIDARLLTPTSPTCLAVWASVLGLMGLKTAVTYGLARAYRGLDVADARHVGLLLSQGGEFAFVAFRLARSIGVLDDDTTRALLTVVSLTMALTPFADDLGDRLSRSTDE